MNVSELIVQLQGIPGHKGVVARNMFGDYTDLLIAYHPEPEDIVYISGHRKTSVVPSDSVEPRTSAMQKQYLIWKASNHLKATVTDPELLAEILGRLKELQGG